MDDDDSPPRSATQVSHFPAFAGVLVAQDLNSTAPEAQKVLENLSHEEREVVLSLRARMKPE